MVIFIVFLEATFWVGVEFWSKNMKIFDSKIVLGDCKGKLLFITENCNKWGKKKQISMVIVYTCTLYN